MLGICYYPVLWLAKSLQASHHVNHALVHPGINSGPVQDESRKVKLILPFIYVGLGSMLGGISRYGLTLITQNYAVFSIPFGTLLANLAGCLLIGLIAGLGAKTEILSSGTRLVLATGFCGGFTTMSSFVYELGQFVQDQEYFYASSYLVATLAGAGLAFVLGLWLSEALLR